MSGIPILPPIVGASARPARRGTAATVLVVDDDPSMRSFLKQWLGALGYQVHAVDTADAAIAFLGATVVNAIVLDVKMPGRPGLDVLEHVRLRPLMRRVPVLILTGARMTPDEEARISLYRAYVFYKQENLEEFAEYLARLAGRQGDTRGLPPVQS